MRYAPRFRWWFLFVVLSLADLLTTTVAMRRGGQELNPVGVSLMNTGGMVLAGLFKVGVTAVLGAVLYVNASRWWARTTLYLAVGILAVVVANNLGFLAFK